MRAADARDRPPPRVLHVTESLAAGVGTSLGRLVQLQAEAGAECTVLAIRRYDTPHDAELRRWVGPRTRLLLPPRDSVRGRTQLLWLICSLLHELRSTRWDAVHFHSSFAGAFGRIAALPFVRSSRVYYSPHGFAFLRQDLPKISRHAILLVERALAAFGGTVITVSESESAVTRRRVTSRVALVPNGMDVSGLRAVDQGSKDHVRPLIAMVGRITYQKAPWRFVEAAKVLSDRADFIWLGYGDEASCSRWLTGAPVEVSGPLERHVLLERLRLVDAVYFPTLWEGMPMALVEAQMLGIPCVVSDVDGNRDVVQDGVTGFVRKTESDMLEALARLVDDRSLMESMRANCLQISHLRFDDHDRGRRSLMAYGVTPSMGETSPSSQQTRSPAGVGHD